MTAAELQAAVSRWPEAARHPLLWFADLMPNGFWCTRQHNYAALPDPNADLAADLHAFAGIMWLAADQGEEPTIDKYLPNGDGWVWEVRMSRHEEGARPSLFAAVDAAVMAVAKAQ